MFFGISLELLESIQDILFSLGIISAITKIRKKQKDTIIDSYKTFGNLRYELNLDNYNTIKLLNLFNESHSYENINNNIVNDCHFSEDNKKILIKIKNVSYKDYSGLVYNFETETHTFLGKNISTHNCDVSRGDSEDATGFCIIDYDTFEQVVEYHGKIPPDIAALLIEKYSKMYNALTTFDITGGMGIATTAKLKEMNFPKKLLHYDNLNDDNHFFMPTDDMIPGINFASKNRRSQIVAALEEAISRGDFKVKSQRLINELKKFIYKNGKPDHQKGSNDDLIMSLGMCLFLCHV